MLFLYSYYLISAYTGGDQNHYRDFYQILNDVAFSDVMLNARIYIDAGEPISSYLLWAAAQIDIDKDIFITLLNIILLTGLYLVAKQHNLKVLTVFLLLTNFYIIVLMTSAERLKIAYILIVWSVYFSGRRRLVFFGISPLAHFQSLIMFPSILLVSQSNGIRRFFSQLRISRSLLKILVLCTILAAGFFLLFSDSIMKKKSAYVSMYISPVELINLITLSIIAFIVTRNRWRMCLLLLPLYPSILLLGGMRVNMIAVTLVLYSFMQEGKMNHPFVILLLIYFSIKSIPFVNNILLYGDGFINF